MVAIGEELELWIGETKYYKDLRLAIADVCDEIIDHLATDYLRNEFLLITNKIDPKWPHADSLTELLDENTSLDKVFSKAAIPVLVTYESDAIPNCRGNPDKFAELVAVELTNAASRFRSRIGRKYTNTYDEELSIKLHFLLIPLEDKNALTETLHEKLRGLQG